MAKGGSFENEIATKLSLWFTDGKRDDVFIRSAGSGSKFTARKKKGKDTANQGGDITFNDSIGEPLIKIWNIEAKTGYSGKKKIKDADGDIIQLPVYSTKKGEKDKIIGWKTKTELKRWDVLDLVDSNQKTPFFVSIWRQCLRDAIETRRQPILIFRRNGRQACICMTRNYYLGLGGYFGKFGSNAILLSDVVSSLIIMKLDAFFDWARPVDKFLNLNRNSDL